MPAPLIPFRPFTPDAPPYLSPDLQLPSNTYPRINAGDGPLKAPLALSDVLDSRCLGAHITRYQDGDNVLIAGTADALYTLAAGAWTDVSKVGGYSVTGVQHWRFATFGKQVLATNSNDPIQAYDVTAAGSFADLAGSPPTCRYIAAVEPGFVMLGYYNDGTVRPDAVRWSGINDATSWPTLGTAAAAAAQSDAQQLAQGGFITGILPAIGGANAAIFAERAIYRCEYVGSPQIFAFREWDRSRGCLAPQSLVSVGATAFFLSEDGFMALDANGVRPIGTGRVDNYFWDNVDHNNIERVYGAADYVRQCVVWAYPTTGAANPNRWLIYSWARDEWRAGDDADLIVEYLISARNQALHLDTVGTTIDPDNVDVDLASYDIYEWAGTKQYFGGFTTSHALVTYQGGTLEARMEGGDGDAEGNRLHITGLEPVTDATAPTAEVAVRDTLGGTLTYSGATSRGADGWCPQRSNGRLARATIRIPAEDPWTYALGYRLRARPSGRR